MTQLVTRVSGDLLAAVDELVEEGTVSSRSDAVRQGLEAIIERRRRARIGEMIVEGYRRRPQSPEELAWADEATVKMIADEPW